MGDTVALTIRDAVAEVRLERPARLNAINPALVRDLEAALARAADDHAVGVVLLHGAGRAFCAGDDLKEFGTQADGPEATRRFVDDIQAVTRRIVAMDAVVIAAAHGWAVGGGLEWLLGCDLALMAEGTGFFFPEAELGLCVTGGASTMLPHRIGLARAKEMLLLGERHDAADALALGLVNRVVPEAELLPAARSMAARVAALPATGRRHAKHVLNRGFREPLDAAMARETEAAVAGFLDPETAARVAARIG